MIKLKALTAAALLGATTIAGVAPAPALAKDHGHHAKKHKKHHYDGDRRYYERRGYYEPAAYDRGYAPQPEVRCRTGGTTGLILGGAAGALLGRAIDTRGERTTGTILGAGAGALLGRELTQKNRC